MTMKVIHNTPPQGRHKNLLLHISRLMNKGGVQLTFYMQVRVYFSFVNQHKNFSFCNFGIVVQVRRTM